MIEIGNVFCVLCGITVISALQLAGADNQLHVSGKVPVRLVPLFPAYTQLLAPQAGGDFFDRAFGELA